MLIRNESFEVLTHGAGALPHEPGLVGYVRRLPGCMHRFGCHCPRPEVRALRAVPDLHDAVQGEVRGGSLQRELQAAPPPALVSIVTKKTGTVAEAENLLERIWPEDPVAKAKRLAVQVLGRELQLDRQRRAQRERLADATMQLGLVLAQRRLAALRAGR